MVSEKQLKELGIENWSTLAKDFDGEDLLLGNGFSMNLAGHFNYTSLFQEFLKNCEPSACKIFKSFGTNNFELIQENLINTIKVNKLFNIVDAEHNISNAIKLLKRGLIKSIGKTHPLSSKINWNQIKKLSIQLNNFGDIFTLSYDLFLYHLIMQMKDEADTKSISAPYSDYFWGGKLEEQFKHFRDYDDYHPKHIYYLHGALFLFKIPPDTLKLKRGNVSQELVAMIGEAIAEGNMPLFVSEGTYKEKLKTIERSDYLSFCYKSLETSEKKLVIFGTSLSYPDTHVANAINYKNKNKRELAIAIHIGNRSRDDLEREMKRLKAKFKTHKIFFFDSETIFQF